MAITKGRRAATESPRASPEPQRANKRSRTHSRKKAEDSANRAQQARLRKEKKDKASRRAKEKATRERADLAIEQDGDSEVIKALRGTSSCSISYLSFSLLHSRASGDSES